MKENETIVLYSFRQPLTTNNTNFSLIFAKKNGNYEQLFSI